jgi:glutamate dehydrogenase (NAD(P)+)
MVIEGANSPTTPRADDILNDKGVFVIPDVMANAGGVVVSYFEWVQNLQHFRWDEREVNDRLGTIMRRAFREVRARTKGDDPVSLRVAAYQVGIERVVEAARLRGYI